MAAMKICFLGAGSLGSAIGGTLALGGAEVTLVNRSLAYVEAVNQNGLILHPGPQGAAPKIAKVRAAVSAKDVAPVDLVVVLVKSFDTRKAMADAVSLIGEKTSVLSLQNGLGNEEILAEIVDEKRLIGGRTYVGGVMTSPGHVIASTQGKETIIGALDGRNGARIQQIKKTFDAAQMILTVSDNIRGQMWDKLLVNVATGAISGLTNLAYGDMYAMTEIEETALAAVAEGMAVAKASGVKLSINEPRTVWLKASEGLPAGFKTSMLQSLEKKGRTEIDFINGAIVRWGEKAGIQTPVNRTLLACIKGLEKSLGL